MSIETINKPMFKTSDGELFDTELEAKQHQIVLDNTESLERFLSKYEDGPGKSRVRNTIVDFLTSTIR